jgi:hypothetical protein
MTNPGGRILPRRLTRTMPEEMEKTEIAIRHKKTQTKRLPVLHFPAILIVPRISFLE